MPENPTPALAVPLAFRRRRVTRAAAAMASGGLVVGMGAVGAAPAFAATSADCNDGNSLEAPADDATDIQTLLDANTAIVCLSGTFTLASQLSFDHDLTLFGLSNAVLDGNNVTRILSGTDGATLTLQNLSVVNGQVTSGDGGAVSVNGDLLVENSRFTANETDDGSGGAIFVDTNIADPTISIVDSVFENNVATAGENTGLGGAIAQGFFDVGSSFSIEGSTFTNNSAGDAGGAVYGAGVLIGESTFTSNAADFGGAFSGYATATFDSTFAQNTAVFGGAIFVDEYAASFGSTFVENTAEVSGGAMSSYGLGLALNSTFVDNMAGALGGAIFTEYGEIALSTFLDNISETDAPVDASDAVYIDGTGGAELAGNIFAGSRSIPQVGAANSDAITDLGGNVFSTAQATEVDLGTPHPSTQFSRSIASIFGPSPALADNGGPTQTVALVAGSPAIDAVPPSSLTFGSAMAAASAAGGELAAAAQLQPASTTPDEDQRSVERTGLADAGAYEYGDAELAATGPDDSTPSVIGGLAALLLGIGAAFAIGTRRLSRDDR